MKIMVHAFPPATLPGLAAEDLDTFYEPLLQSINDQKLKIILRKETGTMGTISMEGEHLSCFLLPRFLSPKLSDAYWSELQSDPNLQQRQVRIFGLKDEPRLTAWYGDPRATYTYSGKRMSPLPWTPTLRSMKEAIEAVGLLKGTTTRFTSVLINLYRDGNDRQGWHSDDERELGPFPIIGSISLGQSRRFRLRLKSNPHRRLEMRLPHGSLLIMRGETQTFWQHDVPKATQREKKEWGNGCRINLTFRVIRCE